MIDSLTSIAYILFCVIFSDLLIIGFICLIIKSMFYFFKMEKFSVMGQDPVRK